MTSLLTFITEILMMALAKPDNNTIGNVFVSVLILIFLITFFIDCNNSVLLFEYQSLLMIGLLLRIFLLYFDVFHKDIYTLPGSGADSEEFYSSAILYSNGYNISYGVPFTKIMGIIARIVGSNRLFLQFIIIIFSIITILFTIKSLRLVDCSARVRYCAIFIMSILPNYTILSSIFLRESLCSMLIAISAYFFVKWFYNNKIIQIMIALAFVLLASTIHSGVIGLAVGYGTILLLYDNKNRRYHITILRLIVSIVLIMCFVYLYNNYSDIFFNRLKVCRQFKI